MKPSFTNQIKPSVTDTKFHPTDEHLIAENKEEVAKINHGDKLEKIETEHGEHGEHGDSDQAERATAP